MSSKKVSKWVASKLKGIASYIGVAFSGYETEVIHILSRIEKNNTLLKQNVFRTPPVTRRQRELRRLELRVNYDRANASTSGMLVPLCLGCFLGM